MQSENQSMALGLEEELHWGPKAAITNYHKPGGLKQQRFLLSQFWRREIWNQGVGRAGSSLATAEVADGKGQRIGWGLEG